MSRKSQAQHPLPNSLSDRCSHPKPSCDITSPAETAFINLMIQGSGMWPNLCMNHQISEEISEAIVRYNKSSRDGITYKINLMIQGSGMWPTWYSLPAPVRFLQILEVTISDPDNEGLNLLGNGGVAFGTNRLLLLLSQFILRGPRLMCRTCHQLESEPYRKLDPVSSSICDECTSGVKFDANALVIHAEKIQSGRDQDHIHMICNMLARSGLLHCKFKSLKVCCAEKTKEYVVKEQNAGQTACIAKSWAGYGWIQGKYL